MAERKELGRITEARFGFGGYQEAMMGLSLQFGGEGWGTGTFEGTWATRPKSAEWSLEDQARHFSNAAILLRDTLTAAKKTHVAELVGVPVEVTFDGLQLSSWRVLKEVL